MAQIIDIPPAGTYRLAFEYTTPRNGFTVGAWGARIKQRFKIESTKLPAALAETPGSGQYLKPQHLPSHGDQTWRQADFELEIPENKDGHLVLVFWADEQGNLDTGIRKVSLEKVAKP